MHNGFSMRKQVVNETQLKNKFEINIIVGN